MGKLLPLSLHKTTNPLQQHSGNVVEMENIINQHKAALPGNLENQSDNKCDAINCFSTNIDSVNLVSCDTCDRTYAKCECIADAYSISGEQVYCCLRCSEVEDIARLLDQKISDLLDEEDLLKKKTILSTILCDNLKAKYNRIIGLREKDAQYCIGWYKGCKTSLPWQCHGRGIIVILYYKSTTA